MLSEHRRVATGFSAGEKKVWIGDPTGLKVNSLHCFQQFVAIPGEDLLEQGAGLTDVESVCCEERMFLRNAPAAVFSHLVIDKNQYLGFSFRIY